jgi:hypothetical protein
VKGFLSPGFLSPHQFVTGKIKVPKIRPGAFFALITRDKEYYPQKAQSFTGETGCRLGAVSQK